MLPMKAGVIGLNWGRVHIGALRKVGVDVVALCGQDDAKAQAIAMKEGIPRGAARLDVLDDVDIVVIASPAPTHQMLVSRFSDRRVICEKPFQAEPAPHTYVNYAFPFLPTAVAARRHIADWSSIHACRLRIRVHLAAAFSADEWLAEVGCHPLAWAFHTFGEFEPVDRRATGKSLQLKLQAARCPIDVELRTDGPPGIDYGVEVVADAGQVGFDARFVPGHPWWFSPLRIDGVAVGESPQMRPAQDPWIAANEACVAAMVECFAGRLSRQDGLAQGLFDGERASVMEQTWRASDSQR